MIGSLLIEGMINGNQRFVVNEHLDVILEEDGKIHVYIDRFPFLEDLWKERFEFSQFSDKPKQNKYKNSAGKGY